MKAESIESQQKPTTVLSTTSDPERGSR